MRKRIVPDLILIIAGFFCVFVLPEIDHFPGVCLFYSLTGYHCAGCGTTRAIHALLRGDAGTALRSNALFVVAVPLSAVYITIRYLKFDDSVKIKLYDKIVITISIITVIIFTILRNKF